MLNMITPTLSTLPVPEIDRSMTLEVIEKYVVVFQEWYGHRGSSECIWMLPWQWTGSTTK